jgi:hypothetical protein
MVLCVRHRRDRLFDGLSDLPLICRDALRCLIIYK